MLENTASSIQMFFAMSHIKYWRIQHFPIYYLGIFSLKLHKNEVNWAVCVRGGRGRVESERGPFTDEH